MVVRALTKMKGFVKDRLRAGFARSVYWNALGTMFGQGSVFLTAVLLARLLGKEAFGELGIIQSTLLTVTSIAQVSTGLTATKYVAEFRDANKDRAGRVLGLCSVMTSATGVVATGLLLISASWVADRVLAAPHLTVSLTISTAFVLFSVMNGYQIGALAGLESYRSIAVYGALLGVAHLLLCVPGAIFWGLDGALGGLALSAFLRWGTYGIILHHEVSRRGITIQRQKVFKDREILLQFTLPAALSGVTATPVIWFGNALLVRQPGGYSEMGLFTAVNGVRALILIAPAMLNNVTVAVINNKFGNKDAKGYSALYNLNIKITAALAVLGSAAMAAFSTMIPKLYGMEPSSGSSVLVIMLSLAIIPEALAIAVYQIIQTKSKMWTSLFWVSLPRDLSMMLLALALIPTFGSVGWALAYTLSWCLALIVIVLLASRFK